MMYDATEGPLAVVCGKPVTCNKHERLALPNLAFSARCTKTGGGGGGMQSESRGINHGVSTGQSRFPEHNA
jgi:hypothetical protein